MLGRIVKGMVLFGAVALVVAVGARLGIYDTELSNVEGTGGIFSLAVPVFAQAAGANEFPNNEVGICAYVKLESIDLSRATAVFAGIEAQEEDYIIGSVSLPSQQEIMWPHIYISRSGWIMAYYPRTEPTSRIFQWIGYQGGSIGTTTLRDALVQAIQQVGGSMAIVDSSMAYYHFQYPTASKMLIAVDRTSSSDSFSYTIPSGLYLHDASWSHYAYDLGSSSDTNMDIDADRHYTWSSGGTNRMECDTLRIQYTSPDMRHIVSLYCQYNWAGTALVFLY